MKQTAVQSLINQLKLVKPTDFCSIETIQEWLEDALILEKQQIIDAWDLGSPAGEVYYNETYVSKKSDT